MMQQLFGYTFEVPDPESIPEPSLAEIFMDDDYLVGLFFKVIGDLNQEVNS